MGQAEAWCSESSFPIDAGVPNCKHLHIVSGDVLEDFA